MILIDINTLWQYVLLKTAFFENQASKKQYQVIFTLLFRILNDDPQFREAIEETVCYNIEKQCQYMRSDASNGLLVVKHPRDLRDINLSSILKQQQETGPLYR